MRIVKLNPSNAHVVDQTLTENPKLGVLVESAERFSREYLNRLRREGRMVLIHYGHERQSVPAASPVGVASIAAMSIAGISMLFVGVTVLLPVMS